MATADLAERLHQLAGLADAGRLPPGAERILDAASARATVLKPLRDRTLIEAAHLLRDPGDGGLWRWPAAQRVVERVRLVEVRRRARWDRNGIPSGAAPVDVLIYRALRLGCRLDVDTRSIWNLL